MFRLTYEVSYIDDLQLWRCFLVHAEEIGAPLAERDVLNLPVLMPTLSEGAVTSASGRAA